MINLLLAVQLGFGFADQFHNITNCTPTCVRESDRYGMISPPYVWDGDDMTSERFRLIHPHTPMQFLGAIAAIGARALYLGDETETSWAQGLAGITPEDILRITKYGSLPSPANIPFGPAVLGLSADERTVTNLTRICRAGDWRIMRNSIVSLPTSAASETSTFGLSSSFFETGLPEFQDWVSVNLQRSYNSLATTWYWTCTDQQAGIPYHWKDASGNNPSNVVHTFVRDMFGDDYTQFPVKSTRDWWLVPPDMQTEQPPRGWDPANNAYQRVLVPALDAVGLCDRFCATNPISYRISYGAAARVFHAIHAVDRTFARDRMWIGNRHPTVFQENRRIHTKRLAALADGFSVTNLEASLEGGDYTVSYSGNINWTNSTEYIEGTDDGSFYDHPFTMMTQDQRDSGFTVNAAAPMMLDYDQLASIVANAIEDRRSAEFDPADGYVQLRVQKEDAGRCVELYHMSEGIYWWNGPDYTWSPQDLIKLSDTNSLSVHYEVSRSATCRFTTESHSWADEMRMTNNYPSVVAFSNGVVKAVDAVLLAGYSGPSNGLAVTSDMRDYIFPGIKYTGVTVNDGPESLLLGQRGIKTFKFARSTTPETMMAAFFSSLAAFNDNLRHHCETFPADDPTSTEGLVNLSLDDQHRIENGIRSATFNLIWDIRDVRDVYVPLNQFGGEFSYGAPITVSVLYLNDAGWVSEYHTITPSDSLMVATMTFELRLESGSINLPQPHRADQYIFSGRYRILEDVSWQFNNL